MAAAHWLYPIKPFRGYVFTDGDGNESDTSAENLWENIAAKTGDSPADWPLRTGFNIMERGDLIWVYAGDPMQAIVALACADDVYGNADEGRYVDLRWHLAATKALMERPISRARFLQIPRITAVRADARTRRVLNRWLRDHQIEPGEALQA